MRSHPRAVTRALHSLTHFPQAPARRWSTRCRAVGAGTRLAPAFPPSACMSTPGCPTCRCPSHGVGCPSAGVTPGVSMAPGCLVPSNCPRGCVGVSVCVQTVPTWVSPCPLPCGLWLSPCALCPGRGVCPWVVPTWSHLCILSRGWVSWGCPCEGVPVPCPSGAVSLCRDPPAVPSGDPQHRQTGRG